MNKPKWLDRSIPLFFMVGISNTLVSLLLMMVLAPLGYWSSTAIAYAVGGTMSFFLNRHLTFHSNGGLTSSALKFALTVGVCYLVSYGLAQPLGQGVLTLIAMPLQWQEPLIKLGGMCLYTILNYIGQRWFAFKS